MMDGDRSFVSELIGKTVLVKTHIGAGTKDASLTAGEYKGILIGFDGSFLKIEYEIRTFTSGSTVITRDIILINMAHVITVEEYRIVGV